MPAPPDLPTWQILPTAGGHFRWSPAIDPASRSRSRDPPGTLAPAPETLPSMADLLLQASSVLPRQVGGPTAAAAAATAPMFRTGSGRAVSLSESSFQKARSVLECGFTADQGHPPVVEGGGGDVCIPMFRSGSGKSFAVRQSSIKKAVAVLEGEGAEKGPLPVLEGSGQDGCIPMFRSGSGKSFAVRPSSVKKAASVFEEEDMEKGLEVLEDSGDNDCIPMFRSGLGKSFVVRQSSIRKAATVLEGEGMEKGPSLALEGSSEDGCITMFRSGSGKSFAARQSSIRKAASVLNGEDTEKGIAQVPEDASCFGSVPMFFTGSGKSVIVSDSSIKKAAAVLEGETIGKGDVPVLEGSDNIGSFPMFHTGSGKSVMVRKSSIRKAAVILEGELVEKDHTYKFDADSDRSFSKSLFQTGSGRTVSISSVGLLEANTLLGLEGNGNHSSSIFFEDPVDKFDDNVSIKQQTSNNTARWNGDHGTTGTCVDLLDNQPVQKKTHTCSGDFYSSSNNLLKDSLQDSLATEFHAADSAQPPIKFHTAGGRSISISSGALQRAKNLLGDSVEQPLSSVPKEKIFHETSQDKENFSLVCQNGRSKHGSRILYHVGSLSNPKQLSSLCVNRLEMIPECKPIGGPLVDISNNIAPEYIDVNQLTSEKKRPGRRSSASPFKKPRISRFSTPLNSSISVLATGSSMLSTSENRCCRTRVSTHYPYMLKRKTIKDFFGAPPSYNDLLGNLPDDVKHMTADNADRYRFSDKSEFNGIGPEAFQNMLLQAGASKLHASKEWVANHYKWIVWKLASFERCYPAHASGKYLTVPNVLEELKYRYEREFNYGHRAALKKILDGDASPASMMVLCVSAIRAHPKLNFGEMDDKSDLLKVSKIHDVSSIVESNNVAKIELTDGWYSLDAFLDTSLSKQLAAGKLFVGQKLRIRGAGLCGWVGPVSPLVASKTVNLLMHINGTYRAHWADPLGFCKDSGAPLAFRCIKGSGGQVPRTLVGVTRIYPVLYKERLSDGGSIVRSDRMEMKALHLYNQRRSNIAEGIMSEQQETPVNVTDNEEGAKIFKILENAAEPEMIMADMSSEQLISFSTFQAKQEASRQSEMQKKIEKALEDAGLNSREVTPFMRVKVVGLTSKGSCRKGRPREGLITIWNPTEGQKIDLVEGKIYLVSGLVPLNFGADILYLQARGSSTTWKSLPATENDKYEIFFTPRKSVMLSNLGEVPLASEFDLAAVIVHVGEVYVSGRQKKQWIFMTDGSGFSSKSQFDEAYDYLLAVSFCSPVIDNDSSPIISQGFSGTTVGFCNLIKRARDQMNHLWVAEATENSTYTVCYKIPYGSHLKDAANSTEKWAKESCSVIQMLRERALCIIGGDGD